MMKYRILNLNFVMQYFCNLKKLLSTYISIILFKKFAAFIIHLSTNHMARQSSSADRYKKAVKYIRYYSVKRLYSCIYRTSLRTVLSAHATVTYT